MTVSIYMTKLSLATSTDYKDTPSPFSSVAVTDQNGSRVTFLFGAGKAQAVADAINAAIGANVPPRDVTEDVLAGVV